MRPWRYSETELQCVFVIKYVMTIVHCTNAVTDVHTVALFYTKPSSPRARKLRYIRYLKFYVPHCLRKLIDSLVRGLFILQISRKSNHKRLSYSGHKQTNKLGWKHYLFQAPAAATKEWYVADVVLIANKCSAVAEMGDRLTTIDMGRKLGLCPFGIRGAGTPSNTMSPEPRPTSLPSGTLIHPAVWSQKDGRKLRVCPFGRWELATHLTQCGLSWGLPPYQVTS